MTVDVENLIDEYIDDLPDGAQFSMQDVRDALAKYMNGFKSDLVGQKFSLVARRFNITKHRKGQFWHYQKIAIYEKPNPILSKPGVLGVTVHRCR